MDTIQNGGYELHLRLIVVKDDRGDKYQIRTITDEHNNIIYQSRTRVDSFAEKNNFVRQFEEHILEPGDSGLREPAFHHSQLLSSLGKIHSSLEEISKSLKSEN
ncbi:MAG: hypothetical protein RSH25_12960 [Bacteroides sp.]|uniref:hypothetical protein n=1 Tax=Bacteroides sp. TaxID=29523 RepID=UPI002FC8F91F